MAGIGKRSLFFRSSVTFEEVDRVDSGNIDPLVKEYLSIIQTLASVPPQEASADQNIRKAVHSLGLAMGKLPVQPAESLMLQPDALRAEAAGLAEQAQREADSIVAASLERQAAALTRQAETVRRMAVLVRRNQVLRQEIAAQVKAFRFGLMATEVSGHHANADFAALAESVAQVAQEADALADARAELDTALGQSRTTAEPVTLAAQIARR